jgi:hypothetical protein
VVCKSQLPDERIAKQGVTCSKQCSQKLRSIRRRKHDAKKCRYCNQPSTLDERKQFNKWRKTLPDRPKRGRKPKSKVDGQQELAETI